MSSSADLTRRAAATAPPLLLVVAAANPARCRVLRGLVGASGFAVVAEATSPSELEAAVIRYRPGAVLLDTDLTSGGLESIERVMAALPTPIVVCGPAAQQPQAALGAGAVSVVGDGEGIPGSLSYVVALRRHLHFASRIRVITHPRARWRPRPAVMTGAAGAASGGSSDLVLAPEREPGFEEAPGAAMNPAAASDRSPTPPPARAPGPASTRSTGPANARPLRGVPERFEVAATAVSARVANAGCDVVVIGASTGGPLALAQILSELPGAFPVPVLVVQHMADGFVEGLAEWLGTLSTLPVLVAVDGARLKPGTVSIAPAGCNVIVHRLLRIELVAPFPNQFHVPGIDATFTSVAGSCAGRAIGVLLTGMGRDGAAGLRKMRESGAMTIAQDAVTSAVYGMPAAAIAFDAVEVQLPLPKIADAITALVARPAPPNGGRRP